MLGSKPIVRLCLELAEGTRAAHYGPPRTSSEQSLPKRRQRHRQAGRGRRPSPTSLPCLRASYGLPDPTRSLFFTPERSSLAYPDAVRRKVIAVVAVFLLYLGATVVMRRRGYSVGGNTLVRCRDGHLYTTIWIPGASLKAVRLGWWRFQRCPVGRHWSLVTPVKESDLTEEERRLAAQSRDVRIP
jgi:hypothetical protein